MKMNEAIEKLARFVHSEPPSLRMIDWKGLSHDLAEKGEVEALRLAEAWRKIAKPRNRRAPKR
jgi:hypothetical protein